MIAVNTIDQIALLVSQFPALVDDVNTLSVKLREQTAAIKAKEGDVAAATHPGLRALRTELVTSRTTVSRISQLIREAAAKARRLNLISNADYERVASIGLQGLGDMSRGATLLAAGGYNIGDGGGGAWNVNNLPTYKGGGVGFGALGVVPVIAWGVAIAIAGSLIIGSFVLAWNAGAESRSRAKAIATQNDALIAAYEREVRRREQAIDAGVISPDTPMPTLQPPPAAGDGGTSKGIATAGAFVGLALLGVGVFLYMKGK